MGAGGRQNYAQAAMQTLFGEQLRQLENQAAQPAERGHGRHRGETPRRGWGRGQEGATHRRGGQNRARCAAFHRERRIR